MTTSPPFLNVPYGGYVHSQVPSEDTELTHVGPGTPAGEWFRRFWLPVLLSDELKDLPKAIRILGQDLVLFRDRSGQIGLLELHCSHRGTSLEFGQIEERGIRCCYHAWLYDVDGKLLETPGEPVESTLKDRLYHGAYPTLEYKGLIFAYMGPPEKRPAFPIFDTYGTPGYHTVAAVQGYWPCNWVQHRDNVMDPAHLHFLHTMPGNYGFSDDFGLADELDFMETPAGMVYISTRRLGDLVWVRTGDLIPPTIHQGCELDEKIAQREPDRAVRPTITLWAVPVDDTHTVQLGFYYAPEGEEVEHDTLSGQTGDRPYEERQRVPGDYDAQTSQRPIAVHAMEHLATTDRGVIMMRNIIRRGVRAVRNGEDPQGVSWREGAVTPTYSHERVVRIPPASTSEDDRALLRDTGRRVAEQRIVELAQGG